MSLSHGGLRSEDADGAPRLTQAGKMKLLGMDIKQTMGVRMDGSMFDG